MKRRRVGPDRSGIAVLCACSSLLYSRVHLTCRPARGEFLYSITTGRSEGHGVNMSSVVDLFLSGFFLDYLRQTTLLHSSSLVFSRKD